MSLKENLKKYREQRGYLNGKDFASAIGIPYPRYMTYERGSWPNEAVLVRIATLLHLTIDDLLGYQAPAEDAFEEAKAFLEIATEQSDQHVKVNITVSGSVIVSFDDDIDNVSILPFKNKDDFIRYVHMLQNTFTNSKTYHDTMSAFIVKKLRELRSQKILAKYFMIEDSPLDEDTDDLLLKIAKHPKTK